MTIAKKLRLGFGILILILILTGVTIEINVAPIERGMKDLTASKDPVTLVAEAMNIGVGDIGVSVLKFLSSSEPKYRDEAKQKMADLDQRKAQYDKTANTAKGKEIGLKLNNLFHEYKTLADTLTLAQNREAPDFEMNSQMNLKKFMSVQSSIARVLDDEILMLARKNLLAAAEKAHQAIQKMRVSAIILFAISLLVGSTTAVIVSSGIIKSVHQLVASAKKIGAGALEHRVTVKTKDELGELGMAFNQMTQNLQELIAKTQSLQTEKIESLSRLAGGAAHEIKNLLGILELGADYLKKKIKVEDLNSSSVLQDMHGAIHKAGAVVKGLLNFASLSEAHLAVAQVKLASILEHALLLVKPQCNESHIEVVKEFQTNLPLVNIDENYMKEVIANGLLNAIQAMPKGGRLWVKTYTKKLEKVGYKVGRRKADVFHLGDTVVMATIEDSGPGIPEDIIKKIFDPFFTTKTETGNTGLGLSVARSIVEAHHGTIEIENRAEGGARLSMMLPVSTNVLGKDI